MPFNNLQELITAVENLQGSDATLKINGTNSMLANLNFGGYIPTNVGPGTAAAPAYCAANDNNTGMFSPATGTIGFSTAGIERIRLDSSGNVGIGTTSPTTKLELKTTGSANTIENVLGLYYPNNSGGNVAGPRIVFSHNNAASTKITTATITALLTTNTTGSESSSLRFGTRNSGTLLDQMTLTSDGKLGINTTSPTSLFNISGSAGGNADISLKGNNTSASNEFLIQQAGDGTTCYVYNRANGPIIFGTNNTSRLTLTSDGNIGIGTTSPNGRITIQSPASTAAEITMRSNGGAAATEFYVGAASDTNAYIYNRNNTSLLLGTNNTTRLTIAANGSFTFAGSVQVNSTLGATGDVGSSGGFLYSQLSTNEGGSLRLYNNGKTGSACYMWNFYNMNSAYTPNGGGGSLQLWRYPASGGGFQTTIWEDNGTMTNNGSLGINGNIVCSGIIYEDASGIAFRGSTLIGAANAMGLRWASPNIYGTVDNVVSAVLGTVSDYRLKENFCEQTQAISIIKLLKPGSYNPVELDGSVSNKVHWGLIAHEVEKVIPSLVIGKKDGINENGDAIYQSVDYAGMVPYLIVAIKEQQAQIQNLLEKIESLS